MPPTFPPGLGLYVCRKPDLAALLAESAQLDDATTSSERCRCIWCALYV